MDEWIETAKGGNREDGNERWMDIQIDSLELSSTRLDLSRLFCADKRKDGCIALHRIFFGKH